MITFKANSGRFNFRVAGLIFHNDRLLIHRLKSDDFYALPGGRVEMMENTERTIIREMKEELNVRARVERLLWIGEQFFSLSDERFHEICYYYLLTADDLEAKVDCEAYEVFEDGRVYEFKWVLRSELQSEAFYPITIKERINNLPGSIEKFVEVDNVCFSELLRR